MQPQQISGYMKPIMTWLKWVSWKIKVSFKGLQTCETLEIILPGTWDGTSLPVLDIFSLWCFWAYLHNCVLIRYRQAADSLKVTHKHWPLSCSLISRPTQPPPLFYILLATHWEIQAAQRCLCDQHWLLFEVQRLRLYPRRRRKREGEGKRWCINSVKFPHKPALDFFS